jgi:hypothetical protein
LRRRTELTVSARNEETAADIADNYGITVVDWSNDERNEIPEEEKDEALQDAVLDYLNENTSVAGVTASGTIVYMAF